VGEAGSATDEDPTPALEGAEIPTRVEGMAAASAETQTRVAGVAAAAAAGVVANTPAPAIDVRTPNRALDRLDPELQAKVERVIERMASEHGVKVEVVEGFRSGERQRFLYGQGRTRPGPVVTWTKNSLHMEGKAADLKVEGPWAQREAYALLQNVAVEEGLGTLGMKDPGHVELPGEGRASVRMAEGPEVSLEGVTSFRSVARPARVARVAQVARPAAVPVPGSAAPRGADAMTPGPVMLTASGPAAPDADRPPEAPRFEGTRAVAAPPSDPRPSAKEGPQAVTVATAPVAAEVVTRSEPDPRRRREAPRAEGNRDVAGLVADTRPAPRLGTPAVAAAETVYGPDPLAQMDRVQEVRDAMSNMSTQRVSVRLDGTAGPVEKVHVDLLDQVLRGRVDVDDPALAARLRADVGQVLKSLGEKGYDARSMAVRMGSGSPDAAAEGMGSWLRPDGPAQALRSLVGSQPGAGGRDPRQDSQGGHGRPGDGDGNPQHSRRENRRDPR
jgi:hypothetical protein